MARTLVEVAVRGVNATPDAIQLPVCNGPA